MSRKNNIDKEIERIEKGDAWEDTDTVVELKAKKPLDKVVPVRLQAKHWETLREIAGEMGIGPTTLARMWILERLNSINGKDILCIKTIDQLLTKHIVVPRLTPLELEILESICQGYTNKYIAEKRGISEETVESYTSKILKKLSHNPLMENGISNINAVNVRDTKEHYLKTGKTDNP